MVSKEFAKYMLIGNMYNSMSMMFRSSDYCDVATCMVSLEFILLWQITPWSRG